MSSLLQRAEANIQSFFNGSKGPWTDEESVSSSFNCEILGERPGLASLGSLGMLGLVGEVGVGGGITGGGIAIFKSEADIRFHFSACSFTRPGLRASSWISLRLSS